MKDVQGSNAVVDTVMKDARGSKATTIDTAMEEIDDTLKNTEIVAVPNDDTPGSSSPGSSKPDEPKESGSLATDFADSFNAFFKNALQKFEDEILNIKF